MILCPNHHVEFDCGVIAIDPKTMRIVHSDADNSFHEKDLVYTRELNMKYIEYHWRIFDENFH
jgi:predicted restriction endonuclease